MHKPNAQERGAGVQTPGRKPTEKVSTKEIPAKAPLAKDPTEDQRQKKCGDEQSPMKESKGKTRITHQIHSRSREEAQSNRTPAKDPVTRELMAVEIRSAPQMNGVEQKNGEGKEDMDEETCTANALNASGRSCLKKAHENSTELEVSECMGNPKIEEVEGKIKRGL
ncbi:hypothetical protein C8R44DRAFT_888716 [Mycena epipterygia]|nr:hypothetical protein C8R44DRAFT_888716 [Mycena epipterygia]